MAKEFRTCPGLAEFNTGKSVCPLDPGKIKAVILTMHGQKLPETMSAEELGKSCHADRPNRIFPIKTIVEYEPSGGEAQTSATGYGPTKVTSYSAKTDTLTLDDYDANLKANLMSAKNVSFDAYLVDENNVIYGMNDGTDQLAGIPLSGVYPGGQDWDSSGTDANLTITLMFKDYEKYVKNADIKVCNFDVVEALRKDLYAKDFKPFPNDVKEQTIGNFNAAYSKAKKGDEDEGKEAKQHLLVDLNVLSDVNHAMLNSSKIEGNSVSSENKAATVVDQRKYNTSLWEQAVERWTKARWTVASLESEDCPLQITRNDGNPGIIDMGFYDNHYYIQARYEGDWNFSKCLKWDNGGRRQREFWWEYPPLAMDVPKGSFISRFKSSPELQQYIIKRVDYLMGVLQKEHRTIQWMNAVDERKDWNLFTWYWSTLACEYQNDEEGKVYMDTMPDENDKSKAIVQLGNRANNVEMLKKTLERIGCPEKINKIDKVDCYVTLATINSLEPEMVGKELNEWIGKISGKNKSNN